MFGYLDVVEFYVGFLVFNIVLASMSAVLYYMQKKRRVYQPIMAFLLISLIVSFTIFILDSIPYLYLDIEQFSAVSILFSNLYLLLLGATTIFCTIILFENYIPVQDTHVDGNKSEQ